MIFVIARASGEARANHDSVESFVLRSPHRFACCILPSHDRFVPVLIFLVPHLRRYRKIRATATGPASERVPAPRMAHMPYALRLLASPGSRGFWAYRRYSTIWWRPRRNLLRKT